MYQPHRAQEAFCPPTAQHLPQAPSLPVHHRRASPHRARQAAGSHPGSCAPARPGRQRSHHPWIQQQGDSKEGQRHSQNAWVLCHARRCADCSHPHTECPGAVQAGPSRRGQAALLLEHLRWLRLPCLQALSLQTAHEQRSGPRLRHRACCQHTSATFLSTRHSATQLASQPLRGITHRVCRNSL